MRRFTDPPTHELRQEWSRLAFERRRDAVQRALDARQGVEASGLGEELRGEGLSEALVGWLDEEGAAWERDFLERHRQRLVEQTLPRSPSDQLGAALVALIVLLIGFIWTVQELRVLDGGSFPVGLLPALLMLCVGWGVLRRRAGRLLRGLWRRGAPPDG